MGNTVILLFDDIEVFTLTLIEGHELFEGVKLFHINGLTVQLRVDKHLFRDFFQITKCFGESQTFVNFYNTISIMHSKLSSLKVVLAHDWLTGFRGGERVLDVFAEIFPRAPLYTLINRPGSTSSLIENRKITTSFLQNIPGIETHYRKALPLFPKAVEAMNIEEPCDLLLSSSHCVIKGLVKPRGAKHVSYVHSPMRYMYDQFDLYFGADASLPIRMGGKIFRPYLTGWDIASNKNVDHFIANSQFVANRIQKYYARSSMVIHPFVDLKDFISVQKNPPQKENYFLMVTAFAPNKRVDLAIEAFNRMKLPLKIVGSGQQEAWLKTLAGPTVEFIGHLTRQEIVQLMAKARAFIFPGVEDFGITPLEVLAAGTPVIAYRGGGVVESLDERVAVFFDLPEVEALIASVEGFRADAFDRATLHERATKFSREKFKQDIEDSLINLLELT